MENNLTPEKLKKLFDFQIKNLTKKNYPEVVIKTFVNMKDGLIKHVLNLSNEKKIFDFGRLIPFLPVVPLNYMDVYSQMKTVSLNNKTGVCFLEAYDLKNYREIPQRPYFIVFVEDGSDTLNISPKKANELFIKDKKVGFVYVEAISLCLHTRVLANYNVNASLSFDKSEDDWVLHIYKSINFIDKPELACKPVSASSENWGTPSFYGGYFFEYQKQA